jgi:hypothetical protein
MILTKQVENEAILSNVGATTDFKIKATAKSFRILADGLYSNKIRAIVRELSCNAYDSHVAAGKTETPFDVHLPNSLESYFSIRDYGVGLSNNEVTNIFTTFFESTKTGSNDFVGALGHGSKSPFSYTDNFTVTAIKDGIKGVYTAFINEHGVPSIALMAEEETTDPNGVEIRFAVENQYDFSSFCSEAVYVYRTFKHKPVVSGNSRFKFDDFEYESKDIITGVHVAKSMNNSVAIMGNIGYPIRIPDYSDQNLNELGYMLRCGLVIEFAIGELDFQASREGLSYIPQTINAIKQKLEFLRGELSVFVEREAAAIDNLWERAEYLIAKSKTDLWKSAVIHYVTTNKFALVDASHNWVNNTNISFDLGTIKNDYNIDLRGFYHCKGEKTCNSISHDSKWDAATQSYLPQRIIAVSTNVHFVITDTKVGAQERAKYHWRKNNQKYGSQRVYVLAPVDKTQPMKTKEFFYALHNPPASNIKFASELDEKPRKAGMGKNVSIMSLQERGNGGRYRRDDMVWRSAGKLNNFSTTDTFYYLPIKGFNSLGKIDNVKALHNYMTQAQIGVSTVYGVRKTDLAEVEALPNWKNLDEHIQEKLENFGNEQVIGLVKSAIDFGTLYDYNVVKQVNSTSSYLKLYNEFKDITAVNGNVQQAIRWLCQQYEVQTKENVDITVMVDKYKQEVSDMKTRYPLVQYLRYCPDKEVANYINMIDNFNNNQKGE